MKVEFRFDERSLFTVIELREVGIEVQEFLVDGSVIAIPLPHIEEVHSTVEIWN